MDLSRFASQPHFRDEKRHTRDMMDHPLRRRRSGKLYGEGTADRPVENPTLDYEAIQKAKNDAKRAQMIPAAYTPDPNDPSSRRPLTRAQRMTTRPALQSSQSDRKAVIADRKRNNMLRSLGINPALYEEVAAGKPISLQTINLLKSQSVAFPGTEPVSVIDGVSEPATSPLTDVKLPKPAPFDAHSPYHRSRKRDPFRVLIDQQAFRLLRKGTRVSAADARRLKLRLSKMSKSLEPHAFRPGPMLTSTVRSFNEAEVGRHWRVDIWAKWQIYAKEIQAETESDKDRSTRGIHRRSQLLQASNRSLEGAGEGRLVRTSFETKIHQVTTTKSILSAST